MTKQRLSKVLAACGVASRRKCEEIILSGVVKVNHEKVLIPQTMVDLSEDLIEVSGKPIKAKEPKVYYMFNKPAGYLCTSVEAAGEKSVLLFFKEHKERLFTVGRLDKDTKGLLFVTNDGYFSQNVIHPSKAIAKEYVAKCDQEITEEHLKGLSKGCLIEGVWVKPLSVKKMRKGTIKIAVAEGKKREVRLLLENIGVEVLELKRVRIGNLHLGLLPEGQFRPLSQKEIEEFKDHDSKNSKR